MSIWKAEVLEILEKGDNTLRVKASYTRDHKVFSPNGFEYTFIGENIQNIKVGRIWDIHSQYFKGDITKTYGGIGSSSEMIATPVSDALEIARIKQENIDRANRRAVAKKNKHQQLLGLIQAIRESK